MEIDDPVEILLVEDNPTDAELVLISLKEHKLGSRLKWVRNGAEALDFLFARGAYAGRKPGNDPRVVLLDLRLPKVDGMEVLHSLKADERTRRIPVAVLTSSNQERDIARCYQLGANSYIVKPVEFDEFTKVVGELGRYWLLFNQPPVCPDNNHE